MAATSQAKESAPLFKNMTVELDFVGISSLILEFHDDADSLIIASFLII